MNSLQPEIADLLFNEFGIEGLENDSPIFSNNLLGSMDVLVLITALEKKYGITISPFDVTIDMFDTISGIINVVSNKLETN